MLRAIQDNDIDAFVDALKTMENVNKNIIGTRLTPLSWCMYYQREKMASQLFEKGAIISSSNLIGRQALKVVAT